MPWSARGLHSSRCSWRCTFGCDLLPSELTSGAVLLFRQFVDDDLGCASYLVGDPEAGSDADADAEADATPSAD